MMTNCSSICIPMKKETNDNCSDDCKHVMCECLHESASDWNSFTSILQKSIINFCKCFTELENHPIDFTCNGNENSR
ncbi:hypothetical protein QQG55_55980 [Brugia pahangi]